MTNTPELDANGNPITPGGDEKVTLSKAEYDAMVERVATLSQSTTSTVEELKELRRINAELKANGKPAVEQPTVEAAVQKVLADKEAEQAKANYQQAVAGFLDEHQEFSTENDPGGIKFAAFQKAVSRMNLTGLKTPQEFEEALNDAYGLMERKQNPMPANNFSSSPRGGTVPKTQPHANLLPEQVKLVQKYFNGDSEAYLKARNKRPAYYEELERYVR